MEPYFRAASWEENHLLSHLDANFSSSSPFRFVLLVKLKHKAEHVNQKKSKKPAVHNRSQLIVTGDMSRHFNPFSLPLRVPERGKRSFVIWIVEFFAFIGLRLWSCHSVCASVRGCVDRGHLSPLSTWECVFTGCLCWGDPGWIQSGATLGISCQMKHRGTTESH